MLFDNQFIIKANAVWEQEMGVEFTKEQRDEKIDRAHFSVSSCLYLIQFSLYSSIEDNVTN